MNIRVDMSFFPDHLIPIVTNSVEIKPFYVKNYHVNNQDSASRFSIFEFSGSMKEFEDLLNSSLQKNSIDEYVVVQDMEKENTLTILKIGDIEQLGILICDFCGAVFNSEDEKYIHQRSHYFF
jgi:hypothetical protein